MIRKHRRTLSLGAVLSLSFACDPAGALDQDAYEIELEAAATEGVAGPTWTAAQVLAELEAEGFVEISADQVSDPELEILSKMVDEVFEPSSQLEYEASVALARGDRVLMHSAPIGKKQAHVDWADLGKVLEHARIFEYLRTHDLLTGVEATLPVGTWLTRDVVAEVLPEFELEELDQFEFNALQPAENGLDQVQSQLMQDCGNVTCIHSSGSCHIHWTILGDMLQWVQHKHVEAYCYDSCSCWSSTYYAPC